MNKMKRSGTIFLKVIFDFLFSQACSMISNGSQILEDERVKAE